MRSSCSSYRWVWLQALASAYGSSHRLPPPISNCSTLYTNPSFRIGYVRTYNIIQWWLCICGFEIWLRTYSEEAAAKRLIYSVSTKYYYAFGCKIQGDVIHKIKCNILTLLLFWYICGDHTHCLQLCLMSDGFCRILIFLLGKMIMGVCFLLCFMLHYR